LISKAPQQSTSKLLRLLVAVAVLLAVLHLAMFAVWRPAQLVNVFPWIITMLDAMAVVVAASVAFLSFGRYLVLREPLSFWTGMGFAVFVVGFSVHLLGWPGLLPGGAQLVGSAPSVSGWMSLPALSLLACSLLTADLSRWPGAWALAGRRWLWSLAAWLGCFLVMSAAVVLLEERLPVLVEENGTFTPLTLAWAWCLILLFTLGALLSARRSLRTGDPLPGYVSITQMVIPCALLVAAFGRNRYGLTLLLDRFVVIGGFLIMQFGLLAEYVRLFRRERLEGEELKIALAALKGLNLELEQRVAERTTHLEEQRREVERRNLELQGAYRRMEEQAKENLRALRELHEKEAMLIQQNRMASMGELLMNIAHQWRQPLNILALVVQELAMQHRLGSGKEELEKNTGKAMEVIAHMSRTIDDFRNFFKSDQQRVDFKVHEAVGKMIAMVGGSFRELKLPIEVAGDEELLASGYPNEFSQVLLNILTNALDAFLENEVPEPCIVIRLFREGERGVVTIADNAGGIPEKVIGRIFDPYFTTKGPDKGTGIGLYMAKSLIENHMHGSLTVRNFGGGAEFRIELPGASTPRTG